MCIHLCCQHVYALVGSTRGPLGFKLSIPRVGNNTHTFIYIFEYMLLLLLINTKEYKKQLMHIYLNTRM
jgi:hypothetical protein